MAYRTKLFGVMTVAALLWARGALGQLDSPILSKVQVNLVNPGGKSLALGGAFVSLADDATAAIANPAGLAQQSSWQLSASGKWMQFSPEFQQQVLAEDGGFSDVRTYSVSKDATFLEFASAAGPVAKNISVSVYYARNLRYKMSTDDLPGQRYAIVTIHTKGDRLVTEQEFGGIDISNEVYGFSAGAKLGPVAIGGGLTLNKLSYELTGIGGNPYRVELDNGDGSPPFVYPVSASAESGVRVGGIVGFKAELIELIRLTIGGVYRWGPTYDVSYTTVSSSGATLNCATDRSLCGGIKVPDDFSIGVSVRPISRLLIAIDGQHVSYSDLASQGVSIVRYTGYDSISNQIVNAVAAGSIENGWIPRVGAEFSFPFDNFQLFLRGGYHREPAHGLKVSLYQETAPGSFIPDTSKPVLMTSPPFSQALSAQGAFDGGKADNVGSVGVGATIARHFSIDAAYEFGKFSKSFVLSAFYRF